ncbi:MAG: zinc ribbon domain-containing protein, partial [Clostridia bacterium]|nr:zinc ribbon domain-containing protein [Clostridia bacterium]
MYCKNCGKEIPDNSVYCTYCGTLVGESVIKGDVKPEEKITFKDAIKALFTRLFVFEGKTGQREFNFGFLFLIIISSALSMIMTMPEANRITQEIMSSNTFDEAIL